MKKYLALILLLFVLFLPNKVLAYDYKNAVIGNYFPVNITINPGAHTGETVTLNVSIDTEILKDQKYLKIAVASTDAPAKQINNGLTSESRALQAQPGFRLSKDSYITVNGTEVLDLKEYLRPSNDGALGCTVDNNGTTYLADCFEFEILKEFEERFITLNFKNFEVIRPSNAGAVFLDVRDLVDTDYVEESYYMAQYKTYPEPVNKVQVKSVDGSNFEISWDSPYKYSAKRNSYEIAIYTNNHLVSPCSANNALFNKETSTPFINVSLPADSVYVLQIKTTQDNATNIDGDCSTYYYLRTTSVAGAILPIIPVDAHRDDYIEVEPYYPPSQSKNDYEASENIKQIYKDVQEIKDQQQQIKEVSKNIEQKVKTQQQEIKEVKSLLDRVVDFLKSIF